MKMKNIIFITFALVLGVAEALGQTYLPNVGATLVSGTIYTATTKTINGTLTVPTGGTVTIYIPAGVTLTINGANAGNGYNGNIGDESPRKSHSHNSTCAGNGGKENACGGAGGNGAMPAICVPTGATLILTGEGTLIATGGNAGSGGNGGNGQDAHGSFVINYYGGAGGAGAGGGGGAAAAIGGAGGHGGAGGYGGEYGANGFFGIIGPGSGGDGGNVGISGTSGQAMGNVWIIGNVTVETTNGNGSTEAAQISNGTQGTSGAKVSGWIPSFSGNMQFFGGNGGNFGYGGSAATYGIGGGGNGGDGGYGGHGGDIFRENQGTENESNEDQSYTPGSAGNGTLYVQQYTSINEPDITRTTHGTVNPITTDAQMPSAIATTFTIDGESTPLRSIFYGTVIEDMDLTTAEKTRTGYTFNGYKIKGTSTQVYDASGTFVYPITTIASSTNPSLNLKVSLTAPANITLEADWIANTYTVTLDKQGGTGGTNSVTATYDSAMPSATAPTIVGHDFKGYFTEQNGAGTKYYNEDMSSARNWDIANISTLYAHWELGRYTVTFNPNGGSVSLADKHVNYNGVYGELPVPTKEGAKFIGWFMEDTDEQITATTTVTATANHTLTAHWEANTTVLSFRINFDGNGGMGEMEDQVIRGSAPINGNRFVKYDETTHENYAFIGWNTQPDGTGTAYAPGDIYISSDEEYTEITLYAQWASTSSSATYIISTPQELLDFATRVNSSSTIINGILAADIDMTGKTWIPIGTTSKPFRGTFDGNGYIVSNLSMANNNTYDRAGLIGYAQNATIENVTVNNAFLYANNQMGGICGRIDGQESHATGSKITRCGFFGTLSYTYTKTGAGAANAVGGITTANHHTDPEKDLGKGSISNIWTTEATAVGRWSTATGSAVTTPNAHTSVSQSDYESGSLCYILNSEAIESNHPDLSADEKNELTNGYKGIDCWTQTFGTDPCPRPTNRSRAVYKEIDGGNTRYYNIYKVYFISNGGTSCTDADQEFKRYSSDPSNPDMSLIVLPTTTRTGYTFQGWFTAKEGGSQVTTSSVGMITDDLILYAHWTPNQYTISFNSNDENNTTTTETETYDANYILPADPTRTGYTFNGWFTEKTDGYKITTGNIVHILDNDQILYAHWTANTYEVSFNAQGGTESSPKDVTFDSTYGTLPTTSRTGYTFNGWFTEAENGTVVESSTTVNRTEDHTLYAHWTAKKCTVILDADPVVTTPGTASINNVTYDQPMPTPEGLTAPTRTGYTFGGYYTGHNGSGTQYYTESMTSATNWLEDTESETTLYAKWTANQYTVSFNARGGSPTPGDITVTYDEEYGSLSTPTRYGFSFNGWYTGETSGTQVTSSTTVHITDDQTLYAHWNPITTDYDSYSVIGDSRLRGNYFRSFYDSHVAYELPDGVTAYKGQADGQYLVLTKIEVTDNNKNILPKDVPVILVAEPSYIDAKTEKGPEPTTGVSIKEISLTTSEYDVAYDGTTGNMLIGTDVDIPVPDDSYLYYILSYGTVTKRLGFYKWPEGNTLSAHKAYVQQSPSSPAKALIFRFENEATGINDDAILDFADDASDPVIYNLNGIRISKPQKGVNIINGKKVWVK